MRVTRPMKRVLEFLLAAPDRRAYGLEIMDATGIKSGTMYPLLHRLADAGMLDAHKEDIDPSEAGRPPRTYFQLTGTGAHDARQILLEGSFGGEARWTH